MQRLIRIQFSITVVSRRIRPARRDKKEDTAVPDRGLSSLGSRGKLSGSLSPRPFSVPEFRNSVRGDAKVGSRRPGVYGGVPSTTPSLKPGASFRKAAPILVKAQATRGQATRGQVKARASRRSWIGPPSVPTQTEAKRPFSSTRPPGSLSRGAPGGGTKDSRSGWPGTSALASPAPLAAKCRPHSLDIFVL